MLVAPNGTPDAIIEQGQRRLAQGGQPIRTLQKKAMITGNYPQPMSPAEVMAYVQAEQDMWKPVLEQIAKNP